MPLGNRNWVCFAKSEFLQKWKLALFRRIRIFFLRGDDASDRVLTIRPIPKSTIIFHVAKQSRPGTAPITMVGFGAHSDHHVRFLWRPASLPGSGDGVAAAW